MDIQILGDKGRVTQLLLRIGKWRFVLAYTMSFSAYKKREGKYVYDDMKGA